MLTVSVLVATKDRPEELFVCLRTVLAQERRPDEVVIIDQSARSSESTVREMCSKAAVALRYEHAPELSGLTGARNRALKYASGDVVLFLDDDVELLPGYLGAMRAVFDQDERGAIGGASGYSVNLASTLSVAQRVRSMLFYRGPFSVERDALAFHLYPTRKPRRAQRLHGSNMAYRRAIFDDRRFDETYSGYGFGEDRDFSVLLARRFTLLWVPEAKLLHKVAPRSRLSRERFCELRVLSWLRFYRECAPRLLTARLAYIWLNVGFLTLLLEVWDWPTVAGTARGLLRLLVIAAGRQSLPDALRAGWRPG